MTQEASTTALFSARKHLFQLLLWFCWVLVLLLNSCPGKPGQRPYFQPECTFFCFCSGFAGHWCLLLLNSCPGKYRAKVQSLPVVLSLYRAFFKTVVNTLQLLLWPSYVGRVLLLTLQLGKPVQKFNQSPLVLIYHKPLNSSTITF